MYIKLLKQFRILSEIIRSSKPNFTDEVKLRKTRLSCFQ